MQDSCKITGGKKNIKNAQVYNNWRKHQLHILTVLALTVWFVLLSWSVGLTCHHERTYTLHPALHGCLHQRGETMAVSPLYVQARVVVQQVVGDCYMALKTEWKVTVGYIGDFH